MVDRRRFIQIGTYAGAGFYVYYRNGLPRVFAEAIPGGTLDPVAVAKYSTPLLIPPAMPQAGKFGKKADYYEIAVRQFQQQILPPGLPATTVWGYGPTKAPKGPAIFNAPSLTIEARQGVPTFVKWVNELVDGNKRYLPHLLPVDPTLHWANPPGGTTGRDMRPTFASTPGRYTGPVPMVTHVHGMESVGDESDGYAEAWFLPNAKNIPAGYATEGTWYDFFRRKALRKYNGIQWGRGFATFHYPNSQRASTAWYHDHTLGMTRLNVYAGPAGFYIIRGGPAGDGAVRNSRGGTAVLPGPAPQEGDPAGTRYYEIPIAIQDRAFNTDGSLFYPDTREFFDGITGPFIPDTDVSPIWNPEFFGNMIMVNGNTWPFLNVEKRRYRFRFLNGCDARFLILDFANIPGVEVWMIGNEGGFLAAPVNMTADNANRLLMSPAERADVIVDFTNVPLGSHVLGNVGPDEPFGGGIPDTDFDAADPDSTGRIMQFNVGPALAPDRTTPPQFLVLPPIVPLVGGTARRVALLEELSTTVKDEANDPVPVETRLGTVAFAAGTGTWTALKWEDPVTENPAVGATEVWEFYNATVDAHPMHIHEVLFQVVNRQAITVDETNKTFEVTGAAIPAEPWENGFKDTVIAYPGQVTRVRMKFTQAGQYVWHCHIVEHEDNEMMRPYRIGPKQPGEPG